MCPACFTALALTVAGTGSAGGLTALIVRKVRRKQRSRAASARTTDAKEKS